MYLMYVDESGDPGHKGATQHFVLSGLVLHESHWLNSFRLIKAMRERLRDSYGIKRSKELHASRTISGRGALFGRRWTIEERLSLMRDVLSTACSMPGATTINVSLNKAAFFSDDRRARAAMDTAWTYLLQRFHNVITDGHGNEHGMVIHDSGHGVEVRKLMRKLRVINMVPSKFGPARNKPLDRIIEDPVERDSYHAQFVQVCDFLAFALLRYEEPLAKYPGLESLFDVTATIRNREASRVHADGVVRIPARRPPAK